MAQSSGDIGRHIIQWGEGQSDEAVAKTIARSHAITSKVVKEMITQGLQRSWVEKQEQQYVSTQKKGGPALKNTQLEPRLALMRKILKYWESSGGE